MKSTKEIILDMLTEWTMSPLLDIRGYYGIHKKANAIKEMEKKPNSTAFFSIDEDGKPHVVVTHNLYKWLINHVDYTQHAKELETDFLYQIENKEILPQMEDFAGSWLGASLREEVSGGYGEKTPQTIDTGDNENSLLDRQIRYVYFEVLSGDYEGCYVLLQVHGHDSYTMPRLFELSKAFGTFEGLGIMNESSAVISCEEDHEWYTEDGITFEPCHVFDTSDSINLLDREAEALAKDEDPGKHSYDCISIDTSTGTAYCPHCLTKLEVDFY